MPIAGKVAVFLGATCLLFVLGIEISTKPIYVAIFSLVPVFAIIAFIRFRWAVLLLLFIASGFIPKPLLPSFSVAGGVVRAEDLLLVLLLVACFVRVFIKKNQFVNNSVYYPFYFLFLLSVLGMIIALGYHNKTSFMLIELRIICYYTYAFLLPISMQNKKDLDGILKFVVVLSVAISITVILQSFTGVQLRSYGDVETLITADSAQHGVMRSRFGGLIFMAVFSFIYTLTKLIRKEMPTWIGLLILSIIGLSVIVTFGRAAWIGSIVSILIVSIWLGRYSFVKIWSLLIALAFVGALAALAVQPNFLDAVVSRAFSIDKEIESGSSYEWRRRENYFAIKKIKEYPFFGIGIGGKFREPQKDEIMDKYAEHFLHSSWLWFVLKFGVVGILFPIWLVIVVLHKAKQLNTSLSIAIGSAIIAPVVVGQTQMEWTTPFGILGITTMIGLLVAHANFIQKNPEQVTAVPERLRHHKRSA